MRPEGVSGWTGAEVYSAQVEMYHARKRYAGKGFRPQRSAGREGPRGPGGHHRRLLVALEAVDGGSNARGALAEAETLGIDPVEHKVAIDGIAVVVNPANGVEELTIDQLGQIFRGEVTNWSEVGGEDMAIVLLSRDSSSGTYEYFKEEVVGEDAEYAASAKLLPSNQAIADEVAANEAGIGYIGLGYLTDDVSVVAIDGVKASVETATDGTYPISRYLYMYSNGEVDGVMQAFLEWILGAEGQQLVEDEGFVPLP